MSKFHFAKSTCASVAISYDLARDISDGLYVDPALGWHIHVVADLFDASPELQIYRGGELAHSELIAESTSIGDLLTHADQVIADLMAGPGQVARSAQAGLFAPGDLSLGGQLAGEADDFRLT